MAYLTSLKKQKLRHEDEGVLQKSLVGLDSPILTSLGSILHSLIRLPASSVRDMINYSSTQRSIIKAA